MKKRNLPFLILIGMSSVSCATILTGTSDDVSFTSNPSGASVFVKNVEKCKTPCNATVQRTLSKSTAELKLDGYQDQSVKLEKTFNPVSLVNILIGGAIGVAVDAATGSLTKYQKKTYEVELEAK
ncbi:PEGA domain-containing protein [Kaistella sp. PBT33-4]|uniref:PEGA domain-containing protein n=1 Tax=Kaistella sp. PBT33-4 TaxID=3032000 RepID=UPI0023D7C44B|nr:PEGA domain-containing protein [Kaistella sp. PBT33-4]MDF0718995.1 PEGA domain-containing protein [Kaistella sp. PBT33-4]